MTKFNDHWLSFGQTIISCSYSSTLSCKKVCVIIVKTRVRGIFPESSLNTDTRIIWTLWHSPLVPELTGFHRSRKTEPGIMLAVSEFELIWSSSLLFSSSAYSYFEKGCRKTCARDNHER